ncbi:hypothetical protein AALB16_08960 [Lachnospiraceae bacterium 62-35]
MKEKTTLCGDNRIACPRYNVCNDELREVLSYGIVLGDGMELFQMKEFNVQAVLLIRNALTNYLIVQKHIT